MIDFVSNKPHYENVPFEIPESWEWVTLGEIGKWQAGGTPNRGHKEYYGGNIPWLKTGDLNDGYITHIPEYITQLGYENSSAKLNPKDSVLIALYGATIGKVGILTFPATTNQACCACIEYTAVDRLYLFYFLRQNRDNFISMGSGGAQPNISKEIITATPIPLPPINEQKRIVTAIEKWFALIDELEANKEDLKEYIKQVKSKVLDLAIHGKLVPQDPNDEPAIELLKRINPNFQPCDTSHYENLPAGWSVTALSHIIDLFDSKRKPIKAEERAKRIEGKEVLYPYYGATGLVGYIDDYLIEGKFLLLGEDGAPFLDPYAEKAYAVGGKFWVNNHAHILRPKIDFDYLKIYLNAFNYHDVAKGTTRLKLTQSDMNSILVTIPPLKEQKRISGFVENLFSIIDSISAEL